VLSSPKLCPFSEKVNFAHHPGDGKTEEYSPMVVNIVIRVPEKSYDSFSSGVSSAHKKLVNIKAENAKL